MKLYNISLLFFTLLLSGCAHDSYTVIPDSEGSKGAMASDLYNCKIEAVHKYKESQPAITGVEVLGIAAGGVLGGAIGGAAVGAVVSQNEGLNSMKKSEINPYVEECMSDKGYSGTSN